MSDQSFQEFTQLALRTESKINSANINIDQFKTLLDIFIVVGTLLDYTKKGIFYNNYTKLDDNYDSLIKRLSDLVYHLNDKNMRIKHHEFNFRIIHGLLGAVTEASELAELLLDYLNSGKINVTGVSEEFEDLGGWYKALIYNELNINEDVARRNLIDKLKVRYPDKFTNECAENRNIAMEYAELRKS